MWALLVNSFVTNTQALDMLLESIAHSDWNNEPIVVVTGGTKEPTTITQESHGRVQFTHVRVPHNSMDFTAMLAVTEIQDARVEFESYMYIHDTCTVQSKFFQAIAKHFKPNTVIPVCAFPSMNMGLLPRNLLLVNVSFLQKHKSSDDWTAEEVQILKRKAVFLEDVLASVGKPHAFMSQKIRVGEKDVYGRGVKRFVQEFPGAQLVKFQANWEKKETYSFDL